MNACVQPTFSPWTRSSRHSSGFFSAALTPTRIRPRLSSQTISRKRFFSASVVSVLEHIAEKNPWPMLSRTSWRTPSSSSSSKSGEKAVLTESSTPRYFSRAQSFCSGISLLEISCRRFRHRGLVEPHELRRVILKHYFNFLLLDAESQKGADEHAHTVDGVQVQHLAEVAADDAAVGADLLDRADRLHRVGDRLIKTRDHRLAVRADIDAQVAELLHLVEQQLVQFEQRVIERRAHGDLFRELGEREQFLKIGVAEADADFFLGRHLHDLPHFGQHFAVFGD